MKTDLYIFDFEKPVIETEKMIEKLKEMTSDSKEDFSGKLAELQARLVEQKKDIYSKMTPWQTVKVARHPKRPVIQDYLKLVFDEFIELHGDRHYSDDPALIGGFARMGEQRVMFIGHNKGKNTHEQVERNFGMSRPEGYRKALRLMHLAEKYNLPVVSFIDTPAAFPGADAEERGQAEAIAKNLVEMARLKVPIIIIVTGEGGSGGALGIGVGDVILMLNHSIYSVIPPEGCAAILWRDASFAEEAARNLKLTSSELLQIGIIEEIIPEPLGGAHHDYNKAAEEVKKAILKYLKNLTALPTDQLLDKRFEKFSKMGVYNQ